MNSRPTTLRSRNSSAAALLLASTALLILPAASRAASPGDSIVVAQAAPPAEEKKPVQPQPGARPPQRPQQPQQPAAQPPKPAAPAAQPAPGTQPAPQRAPAAQQAPAAPPRPTAQDRRDDRRDERRDERREQQKPTPPQAPAVQQPQRQTPAAQPQTTPPAQQRQGGGPDRRQGPPGGQQQAPAVQQQQQSPAPPAAQQQQQQRGPATQQPGVPPAAQQQQQRGPATQQPPVPPAVQQQQNVPSAVQQQTRNPAVIAPPTQTRDASEFMRRDGQGPARGINQVRQERQESREGNRTFIREGDRTIVREGDRTIIRHNESNRFAIGARNIQVERRGANSETIIERGNGVRIITITDPEGRLVRRYRRDPSGREIVFIDNGYGGARVDRPIFINLPPPIIRIPRQRYILDAGRAQPNEIYAVFEEPPVEVIEERYTLDQVRFSAPLRDRMPRVDLDVNFDTGSWQLSPDQIERLAVIADGINRAIQRNPSEVFMIEGHTDAVGNDVDNLSLSDRRAESVAVALTEQFQVPAENLVTQGYGEQYLKIPTQGPEIVNRRVAVRRITPLIDQQARNAPPPR